MLERPRKNANPRQNTPTGKPIASPIVAPEVNFWEFTIPCSPISAEDLADDDDDDGDGDDDADDDADGDADGEPVEATILESGESVWVIEGTIGV